MPTDPNRRRSERIEIRATLEERALIDRAVADLLQDVIARTVAVGREIGCRGLLVHAESREARDFYRHLIPQFEASHTDDLHLVSMVKFPQRPRCAWAATLAPGPSLDEPPEQARRLRRHERTR